MQFSTGFNDKPSIPDELAWAHQEFGQAQLGDRRRTERLVSMAAAVAQAPSGLVTQVFPLASEREGAYRFLENNQVSPSAMTQAARQACLSRCTEHSVVLVPMDGSSLNLPDRRRTKGMGSIGTTTQRATGLLVLTALAVTLSGIALGVLFQLFWTRPAPPPQRPVKRRLSREQKRQLRNFRSQQRREKPMEQKEMYKWVTTLQEISAAFQHSAPKTVPWYQCDRAADMWAVYQCATKLPCFLTVRAHHNRCLMEPYEAPHLYDHMQRQEPLGSYQLHLPATPTRKERTAALSLRAARVHIAVGEKRTKQREAVAVWAVWVTELGAPAGAEAIDWLLLTTYPVDNNVERAYEVVRAYGHRWHIENFHHSWKSGVCRVEDTQLGASDRVQRWAIILASVAMRVQRLLHLARNEPERPATCELSQDEIDAAIVLHKRTGHRVGTVLTIKRAVHIIAELGGYTGEKSSGGPPGPKVLARGLVKVEIAAEAIAIYKQSQSRGSS